MESRDRERQPLYEPRTPRTRGRRADFNIGVNPRSSRGPPQQPDPLPEELAI